jgi:divalent metal cation (Fe/Co/Zn/Cd) transporter
LPKKVKDFCSVFALAVEMALGLAATNISSRVPRDNFNRSSWKHLAPGWASIVVAVHQSAFLTGEMHLADRYAAGRLTSATTP